MPKQSIQLYVFSAVWYAPLSEQPTLHKALKQVAKNFVYQLEKGEKKGKLHYQIYFKVRKRTRANAIAKVMSSLGVKGVNVKPCSTDGKLALSKYCMKKDTRVDGPWADKRIYLGADLPKKLYPWQQKIVDIIKGPVDDRAIHWFHDEKGGAGKSTFAKYMYFHHQILTLTFGDAKDLLYVVSQQEGLDAYMFDLSRTKGGKSSMSDIYQSMESIKNGYFTSTKYETKTCCFNKPHVIIFSNHLPNMKALSADRWKIHKIEPKEPGLFNMEDEIRTPAERLNNPDFKLANQHPALQKLLKKK